MIQKWIKDQLKTILPALEWTNDYKTGDDNTGVVYMESPGRPSQDDFEMLFPTYSVQIETSDRSNAEVIAWKVYESMNKQFGQVITLNGVSFDLIWIHAIPPLPVGIDGKKITYSINLQTTIRKTTKLL